VFQSKRRERVKQGFRERDAAPTTTAID